jgi:hypothetical protein
VCTGGASAGFTLFTSTGGERNFNAGGVVAISDNAATYTPNTFESWIFSCDSSGNLSLLVDGTAHTLSTTNATPNAGSLFWIGGAPGVGNALTGAIYEVIVYSQKLTTTQLNQLVAYQLAQTGL